jgi:hypothetical protein
MAEVVNGKGIELFHSDGKASGVFYCSLCRIVYKTQKEADECHGERLCGCGAKLPERYQHECHDCYGVKRAKEEDERESARYAKAKKITADEYDDGFVFSGDRFFSSLDEALDYFEDEEFRPEYVWACKNIGLPKADIESVIERLIDNMWEDASADDLKGVDELQAAIDKFNEENKSVGVWNVDYSTAITIPPAAIDTYEVSAVEAARKSK